MLPIFVFSSSICDLIKPYVRKLPSPCPPETMKKMVSKGKNKITEYMNALNEARRIRESLKRKRTPSSQNTKKKKGSSYCPSSSSKYTSTASSSSTASESSSSSSSFYSDSNHSSYSSSSDSDDKRVNKSKGKRSYHKKARESYSEWYFNLFFMLNSFLMEKEQKNKKTFFYICNYRL